MYPAHLLALHRFEFIPVPFPLCSRYSTTPNQTPFFTRASLPVMLPVCDYLAPFFTRLPRPPTVANSARRVLGSPPFNIGSAVPSCVPQHARQRQRILSFRASARVPRALDIDPRLNSAPMHPAMHVLRAPEYLLFAIKSQRFKQQEHHLFGDWC